MKHIQVIVNGVEYVNREFEEFHFSDGPESMRVEGCSARAKRNGNGSGLLDMLAAASRGRTDDRIREKRATLAEDGLQVPADEVPASGT